MEFLKNNKGLVIFYLCVTIFSVAWVLNVDKTNDKMMMEKNPYILSLILNASSFLIGEIINYLIY